MLRTLTTAVVTAGLAALAVSAHAIGGGEGKRMGRPAPGEMVLRNADELGLDDATRSAIESIAAESRDRLDALRAELREEKGALRDLLEADAPDAEAVMSQADVIGEIQTEKRKFRLAQMLRIRELLTPEQRERVAALVEEHRETRRERRAQRRERWGQGRGGS